MTKLAWATAGKVSKATMGIIFFMGIFPVFD
jgi:hypothetical protein